MNIEFHRLLRAGIASIAALEGKRTDHVEDELGELNGVAGKTIQHYKGGYPPPASETRTIEILAAVCVTRGNMNRYWLERFLTVACYPRMEHYITALFPESSSTTTTNRLRQNLPSPTYSQFVMREALFEQILQALQKRLPVVLVYGFGGFGKSCLALEVAKHCLRGDTDAPHFDAFVWVSDKDREGTTHLDFVLDAIARTLDFPGLTQEPHMKKRQSVDHLLRAYRVLLILDNYESITDTALREWVCALPEPGNALVTTRELSKEWEKSWPIHVGKMTEAEAEQLVAERIHVLGIPQITGNQAIFDRFLELTGGNPKAITVSLGLYKYDHRPVQQIIDDLCGAQGDLFDHLFTRAWKLLTESARRIALVASFFVDGAPGAALAATANVQGREFTKAMETLTDLSLLEVQHGTTTHQPPRYTLHALARLFLHHRLREQPGFEADARERWCQYFLASLDRTVRMGTVNPCYWDCVIGSRSLPEEIVAELPNLLHVLDWVERTHKPQILVHLMLRLTHLLGYCSLFPERIHYAHHAAQSAWELHQYEHAALFHIDALGWALTETDHLIQAEEEILAGLHIADHLIQEPTVATDLRTLSYAFLARVALEKGCEEVALDWIARALPMDCHPVIRRRVLEVAGDIECKRHRYQEAIDLYHQAHALVHHYDVLGETTDSVFNGLGFAYVNNGNVAEAEVEFCRLLALGQQVMGSENFLATYGLACVAQAQGDLGKALTLAQHARDTLTRLGIKHRLRREIGTFLDDMQPDHTSS